MQLSTTHQALESNHKENERRIERYEETGNNDREKEVLEMINKNIRNKLVEIPGSKFFEEPDIPATD